MRVHARRLVVAGLCLVLAGCASSAEVPAATPTPATGPSVVPVSPTDTSSQQAEPEPSGWTLVPDAPVGSEYHDVSCVASGRCWVAAADQVLTLEAGVEFSDAGAPRAASLWGVDCPQDGTCYAVGATKDTIKPYLSVLRGGAWTMVPLTYSGPQKEEAALLSVSCPSPSSCWAAGDIQSEDLNSGTLIVFHGSGTHWQQVAVPSLHSTMSQGSQEQITCPTVSFCLLTETYAADGGDTVSATRLYSSGRWTQVPVPAGRIVTAAGCSAAGACQIITAPMFNGDPDTTLSALTGHRWGPPVTLPTGEQGPVEWTAMSCTAKGCVAVGGVPVTPGETLQAASISLGDSPTVTLAGVVGQFLGVDCDARRCEAVGNQAVSPDSANYKALAGVVPR